MQTRGSGKGQFHAYEKGNAVSSARDGLYRFVQPKPTTSGPVLQRNTKNTGAVSKETANRQRIAYRFLAVDPGKNRSNSAGQFRCACLHDSLLPFRT